jgi:hypothetical protein
MGAFTRRATVWRSCPACRRRRPPTGERHQRRPVKYGRLRRTGPIKYGGKWASVTHNSGALGRTTPVGQGAPGTERAKRRRRPSCSRSRIAAAVMDANCEKTRADSMHPGVWQRMQGTASQSLRGTRPEERCVGCVAPGSRPANSLLVARKIRAITGTSRRRAASHQKCQKMPTSQQMRMPLAQYAASALRNMPGWCRAQAKRAEANVRALCVVSANVLVSRPCPPSAG